MATPPYDTLGTVLSATRVKVNDAIVAAGTGQTLTNTASFTPFIVKLAWRGIQNKLRAIGYTGFGRLKENLVIPGLPASASSDPAVQNYISWTGFWDGVTLHAGIVLPQEFLAPMICWERPNGISANFTMMDQCLNGIPTNGAKQSRNLNWDWIDDQLSFPGSTITWDLRVRCLQFLADFASPIDPTEAVPIVDCLEPFSDLIAREFSAARDDLDTQAFEDRANISIAAIYSRDTAQMKAVSKPSEYKAMRNPYTPGVTPPAGQQAQQGGGQ